jgi:hypothetical protein
MVLGKRYTMNGTHIIACCALVCAALALTCGPVSAVILETAYTGTVTGLNPSAGTMTIDATARYGIDYTASGAVASWTPITPASQTGTVPDKAVFNLVRKGDTVRAVNLGGDNGPWITVAKVNASEKTAVVQAIIGEPQEGFADLMPGNLTVSYTTSPDCKKYNTSMGTVAPALSAGITLTKDGRKVMSKVLKPGASMTYKDKAGNGTTVLFVKGQALSSKCKSGSGMMTGPQAVSVFVITPVVKTK